MRRKKAKDASNQLVVGMLVTTILVSLVSWGVYLDVLSDADPQISSGSVGIVQLIVAKTFHSMPTPPLEEHATVALTVIKPKKR